SAENELHMTRRTRSFEPNASKTVTLPGGQVAHELHVEQSHRLARTFSEVRPGVWCFVVVEVPPLGQPI
ncbi:MAG: hypothetical protein ACKODX_08305, partial [Gemmata sp.]